jgi:hypothetical protein
VALLAALLLLVGVQCFSPPVHITTTRSPIVSCLHLVGTNNNHEEEEEEDETTNKRRVLVEIMVWRSAAAAASLLLASPLPSLAAPPIAIIAEELGYFPVTNRNGDTVNVPKRVSRTSSSQAIDLAKHLQTVSTYTVNIYMY